MLGSLAFFGLGLLGHEVAATLPALVLAMELFIFRRPFTSKFLVKYAFYVGCLVVYLLITLLIKETYPTAFHGADEGYHLIALGMNQVRSLGAYLVYLFLPQIKLRLLEVNVLTVFTSGIIGIGLLLGMIKGSRFSRFWISWVFLTLLPFILFVPFGNADRYFYLVVGGH